MASYNNNPYTNGLYPVPFSSNGGGSDPSTLSLNASNSNDIDALCTPWSQGITPSRKFQNCPTLGQDFTIPELRLTCPHCGLFFVRCCHRTYRDERDDACHHFHIIMTDGACLDNGSVSTAPVAGLGIAFGDNNERHQQLSIPVTDDIDKPNLTQTSQRAELLAAIHGLKSLHHEENNQEHHGLNRRLPQDPAASNISAMKRRCYIITTDSKYVVDGMTEWLSVWKVS
jgi:ribonuclease HI